MSFIKEYPTMKTPEEEALELKARLENLIRTALMNTAKERKNGLMLSESEIRLIVSGIRKLSFDNSKNGVVTLEGIINRVLHNSNDPSIKSILSRMSKIYNEKQNEFMGSEEYVVAQEVYKKHPGVMEKIMLAFDIASCEEQEDGTVKMYCKCDESRCISITHDKFVVITKNGKTYIRETENDESKKVYRGE